MTFYGREATHTPHAYPQLDSLQLSHPVSSEIIPVWAKHEYTTLNGKTLVDVANRKYKYVLYWSHMNIEEYNALEAIAVTNTTKLFIYDKYSQAESPGVSVWITLKLRKPKEYYEHQKYYSEITLELLEEDDRI
jgi:hypothetical protein